MQIVAGRILLDRFSICRIDDLNATVAELARLRIQRLSVSIFRWTGSLPCLVDCDDD